MYRPPTGVPAQGMPPQMPMPPQGFRPPMRPMVNYYF